jgi:hypothetical protein
MHQHKDGFSFLTEGLCDASRQFTLLQRAAKPEALTAVLIVLWSQISLLALAAAAT